MSELTATVSASTSRTRKRRTRVDAPASIVNHEPSATIADPAAAHEWADRLLQFGFAGATVEWLRSLSAPLQKVLQDLLDAWEKEYHAALQGEGDPFPTAVPSFLKAFDAATPEQSADAAKLGAGASIAGYKNTDNPYPPGTALRAIWKEAFTAGKSHSSLADPPEATKTSNPVSRLSPREQSQPRRLHDSHQVSEAQSNESIPGIDRERRRHDYIEQLRSEIEECTERARETRSRMEQLERDARAARTAWNDTVSQAEMASEKLQLARAGIFPNSSLSPLENPVRNTPVCEPDSEWKNDTNPQRETDVRLATRIDQGAAFDLSSLQRGRLQKITDCDLEWGLSARQVERLKECVNGMTIEHLEKFQRETFNWEQAIPGFGEAAITKLQDAHLALRIKYDMPVLDEVPSENPGRATTTQAIERLSKLIDLCEEVIDEDNSDDRQPTEFCESVASQANELRQQLINQCEVTTQQLQTIDTWLIAVENCAR